MGLWHLSSAYKSTFIGEKEKIRKKKKSSL